MAGEVEELLRLPGSRSTPPAVAPAPPDAAVLPTIVDVGCDHAGLGLTLLHRSARTGVRVGTAIAVDLKAAPCALARLNAARLGLPLDVRQGDGLAVVPETIDVVTLCGMGSETIVAILEAARLANRRVHAAVVQPNDAGEAIRRWCLTTRQGSGASWSVVRERGVWDRRYYGVLVLRRHELDILASTPAAPDDVELAWGPSAQLDRAALARRLDDEISRLDQHGKPTALALAARSRCG